MSEEITGNNQPRILETTSLPDGVLYFMLNGSVNFQDILTTLEYHQPDDREVGGQLVRLFDSMVERGMLAGVTIRVTDPAEGHIDHVDFQRHITFGEGVTVDAVERTLLEAYGDPSLISEKKIKLLAYVADAGALPSTRVKICSVNEMLTTTDEQISLEMGALTERFYGMTD